MKNLLKITAVLFISLTTFQSCNDDNDNAIPYEPEPTTNSIVDVALGSENLSTLVAALQKADLVTTLASVVTRSAFCNAATSVERFSDPNATSTILLVVGSGS